MIADIEQGYDRVAHKLSDALANPPCKLSAREYQLIFAVITKTYRFHKKTDWIATSQLSELTGIDQTNVGKIKRSLISKNVLILEGKNIGINPIISDWGDSQKRLDSSQKRLTGNSQKRLGASQNRLDASQKRLDSSQKRPPQKKETNTKETNTKKRERAKKTKFPDEFFVTSEMRQWAVEEHSEVNLKSETERFADHFRGNGETKADWVATWRNWIRRSVDFLPAARQKASTSKTVASFPPKTLQNIELLQGVALK